MRLLLLATIAILLPSAAASWALGWQLQPPWEISSHTLLPSPLLHIPVPLSLDGNEEFLLAQGKFGSDVSGDAVGPPLPASSMTRTLSYKYAKVGAAELQVLLKDEDNSFRLIDAVTEQTAGRWKERTTVLPAGAGEQQLYFRARGILDGLDAVAISSVDIRSPSSSVLSSPKEIRRKPLSSNSHSNKVCEPLQCSFHRTSCLWTFSGFSPLDGKMIAKESGVLSSEPVLQPSNAHFQMEIFATEGAAATVHQRIGPDEQLLWTAGGVALPGWNTVRLPLKFSSLPSRVLVRAASTRGGYVAVRNTRLVDEFGNDLSCGTNAPAIRPKNDGTIRLTAVQRLEPAAALPITPTQVSRAVPPESWAMFPSVPSNTVAPPSTIRPSSVDAPSHPKLFSSPETTSFMKNLDKWKSKKLEGLGEKAIAPVNVKTELTSIPSSLAAGIPMSLQKAFSDKLSQFIELPPATSGRETRPFSRQNMDWVVQHAFNAFMNQARP